MKKIVSLISAAAIFAALSGAVIAEDNSPAVYVNGAKINFADQEAVIVDGRTLVPARGVFEVMDSTVTWDGEQRLVEIATNDNMTLVRLTIDSADMSVFDLSGRFAALLSGQDFKAPENIVTLDVPAQIMNDRTMIPLRAISEAVGADVQWDAEGYKVDITTKDAPTPEQAEKMPTYFLTTSSDNVAEDETVDVFVNVKNLPSDTYASAVTAVVEYNNNNFEYVSSAFMNGDNVLEGVTGIDNPELSENQVKIVYITIDGNNAPISDGHVAKLTFRAKNTSESSFLLANSNRPVTGYDITLLTTSLNNEEDSTMYDGSHLYIDTTPIVVNAAE